MYLSSILYVFNVLMFYTSRCVILIISVHLSPIAVELWITVLLQWMLLLPVYTTSASLHGLHRGGARANCKEGRLRAGAVCFINLHVATFNDKWILIVATRQKHHPTFRPFLVVVMMVEMLSVMLMVLWLFFNSLLTTARPSTTS